MSTSVIFVLGALAFSILAGVIEAVWARRERRLLREKSTVVLHRLTRHRFRRVRSSPFARARHHVGLFVGFLFVTYVGMLLLKTIGRVVAHWF
jgi:hypothetical protein